MAGAEVLNDEVMVVHRLTILGLPVQYCSTPPGVTIAGGDVPGTSSGLQYTVSDNLQEVSDYTISADSQSDAGALVLTLVTFEDQYAEDEVSLLTTLAQSVDWYADLTAPATKTATTIYVDRDLSGDLSLPQLVHVGHEAMWATAFAGAQPDPNVANPYRLTVVRGAADTKARAHAVDPTLGAVSRMFSHVVTWKRRPAVVEAAPVYSPHSSAPKLGTWVEIWRGFVEDTPQTDGPQLVVVTVAGLNAVFDLDIDVAATETGLVHGFHEGDEVAASALEYAIAITGGQSIGATHTAAAAGTGTVLVEVAAHDALFDFTVAAPHPRRGRIDVPGTRGLMPTSYVDSGVGPATEGIAVDRNLERAVQQRASVTLSPAAELKHIALPTGAYVWPWDVIDAINTAALTGDATGYDGALLDWQMNGDDSATVFSNVGPVPRGFNVVLFDPHPRLASRDGVVVYAGQNMGWPPFWNVPQPLDYYDSGGDSILSIGRLGLLYYPLYARVEDAGIVEQNSTVPHGRTYILEGPPAGSFNGESATYTGVFQFAEGFYQQGEPDVLVTTEIASPAGTPFDVIIEWSEPWKVDQTGNIIRQRQRATVSGVASVVLPDGADAYRVTWSNPDRVASFGDWPGTEPATIRVDAGRTTGAELLVNILETSLGLTDDEVDFDSIRAFGDPPGLTFGLPTRGEPQEARKVIDGLLFATSTGLVMKTDSQGRCRLTRVGLMIENPGAVIDNLSDDDCTEFPRSGTTGLVIRSLTIKANYGADGKPALDIPFRNAALIAEGGSDGEVITMDLLGAVAESADVLTAIAVQTFARWGRPNRTWEVVLPLVSSHHLWPGADVGFNSAYAKGTGRKRGVAGYGRIMEITRSPKEGTATVVMTHTAFLGAGWNACLLIIETTAADEAVIDTAAYILGEHPVTGAALNALDLWLVGDAGYVTPFFDDDSETAVVITDIDYGSDTVTFVGAHGLGVLGSVARGVGHLRPAAYDSASTLHQGLAYIVDSNGTLGAGSDAGKRYS